MKNFSKRLFLTSGIIATVCGFTAGISYSVSKLLIRTALDRKAPDFMDRAGNRISGSASNPEVDNILLKKAENLRNINTQTVKIKTSDGINLTGHWYPCQNAKRTIIAMHGWRSTWDWDFGSIAPFLHQSGCNVLFADQRGQNKSEGEYISFGILERYDCVDWAKWVNQTLDVQIPIYLFGVSMGAATVLMSANLNMPSNVHGIVSDCAFTSPGDIWEHVVKNNLHIPYRLNKPFVSKLFSKKLNVKYNECTTFDAVSKTNIPIMFIHGTDDQFVPVEMTYKNYKACSSPKKLFIVPGANHARSYFIDKNGYEKAMSEFFNEND